MGRLDQKPPSPEPEASEPEALRVDVKPEEIPELAKLHERLLKARARADRLPAEATAENKGEFATALEDLRNAKRDLEDARKKIARQFDGAKKRVKGFVDEISGSVAAAYESVEARLLDLEAAERRADEEEQKAEEERRKAEQKAENAEAEEEGRRARHVPPPAPRKRPTGARASSGAKATPVKEVKYKIVDEEKIPDEYWKRELNRSKIGTDVRAGVVIPGVEPYVDESMRVQ